MEGQTPNIHVVHSVWRGLKKAKIRDLQPIKDVKGGGGWGGSHPPCSRAQAAMTIRMLLLESDSREKNGEGEEAAKIRAWVANLLREQSKVVRSVWRRLPQPS